MKKPYEEIPAEALAGMFINIKKMSAQRKPEVKKYLKYRKMLQHVFSSLSDKITPDVGLSTGKKLGFKMHNGKVFVKDEVEERLIHDYLFVHATKNGDTIINSSLRRIRNPVKRELLSALKNSRLSVYELVKQSEEKELSNAYVRLRDIFTGDRIDIIDIALSTTGNKYLLYPFRILKLEDFNMTSGFVMYHFYEFAKDRILKCRTEEELYKHIYRSGTKMYPSRL